MPCSSPFPCWRLANTWDVTRDKNALYKAHTTKPTEGRMLNCSLLDWVTNQVGHAVAKVLPTENDRSIRVIEVQIAEETVKIRTGRYSDATWHWVRVSYSSLALKKRNSLKVPWSRACRPLLPMHGNTVPWKAGQAARPLPRETIPHVGSTKAILPERLEKNLKVRFKFPQYHKDENIRFSYLNFY